MCAVNSIRSLCSEQGLSQAGINHPTRENKSKICQVFQSACLIEPAWCPQGNHLSVWKEHVLKLEVSMEDETLENIDN